MALGRSRGRLSTKIYTAVEALGNPLAFAPERRARGRYHQSGRAHRGPACAKRRRRQGYDADAFIATIHAHGAQAVIPPRSNRLAQRAYDRHLYKDRNLIERFFSRLKHVLRIANRYEKPSQNFMSMLNLACAYLLLA